MDLSVFFAGTSGSIPTVRRGLPALLVRRGGDRILFDCGEGTQRQLVRSVGLTDLDEVFLTHYHADHWLGLPGMLKTFDLRARERPLAIHGPRGLRELIALGVPFGPERSGPTTSSGRTPLTVSPRCRRPKSGPGVTPRAAASSASKRPGRSASTSA